MTGLRRAACLIGSAVALVLSASGCTDYTYFNVHVTIDGQSVDDTTRRNIDACVVYVFAGNEQIEAHKPLIRSSGLNAGAAACGAPYAGTDEYHNVTNDIGTMDYSTARSSGSVRFFVDMESLDQKPSVQGSAQGNVNPGQVVSLNLVAEPCGGTTEPACIDVSSYK